MDFTLFYRGPLKTTRDVAHRQDIRAQFHRQLRVLWDREPLRLYTDIWKRAPSPEDLPRGELAALGWLNRFVEQYEFVPLITRASFALADLDITLLRPGSPVFVLDSGGDIDNRLKTLFDALSMPQQRQQVPQGWQPSPEEKPFFCLLEDDRLVSSVRVSTATLLEEGAKDPDVVALIRVRTSAIAPTRSNSFLA